MASCFHKENVFCSLCDNRDSPVYATQEHRIIYAKYRQLNFRPDPDIAEWYDSLPNNTKVVSINEAIRSGLEGVKDPIDLLIATHEREIEKLRKRKAGIA